MLICSVNMTDTKRLRERTEVLSFFINILILERGSGMKSFSAFITEKKKPEKPDGVNQANVSKDAANYRRAQRQRSATGGPTTGRTGNKSFPGDRSGAYAKAKADLEARKGFSGSKSGGLKADEANPNVNRAVRQQRTVKQGIPDPFKSSTRAPENPFKGLKTGNKPTAPDPFKGASSVPEPKLQGPARPPKPPTYSTAGPATRQAMGDIAKSSERLKKAGVVLRTPGDNEKLVSDPPKPRKTPSVSSANKTTGAEFYKKPTRPPKSPGDANTRPPIRAGHGVARSRADAIRGGMKGASVGQDRKSGADLLNRLTGQKSGFQKMSQRADEISADVKAQAKKLAANTKGSQTPSKPPKSPTSSKGVTAGLTAPKDGVKTSPGVGPKSYTKAERTLQDMQRQMAQSGVDPSGRRLSNPERIRAMQVAKNPRAVELVKKPKVTTGTGGALTKFGASTRGTTGSSAIFGKRLGGTNQLMTRSKDKVTFRQPSRAGTPEKVSNALASARKGSQTLQGGASKAVQASRSKDVMKGMMKQAGGVGGKVLGAAGSALDAYTSYKTYRKAGDDRLRAGLKSAFRTSVGWLGGAAGSALGSFAGPAGTVVGGIGGYGAGVSLADKVLSRLRKPSQRKKK